MAEFQIAVMPWDKKTFAAEDAAAAREAGRGSPFVEPRTEARGAGPFRVGGAGPPSAGVITAPGANLAEATPGGKPEFTPFRTSPGGSMVLGKDNLGIEEIRGTGHPSSQVFTSEGRGEDYPEAVQRWHEGMAREAGETTRAGMLRSTELEKAQIEAKAHVEAMAAYNRDPAKEFATEQARAALPKQQAEEQGKAFDTWLHNESPYTTFDPKSGKLGFMPKDEGMARDQMAARSVAGTQGFEAAKKLFAERQEVRKWLLTQPLRPDADIETWLNTGQANPEHWARLLAQVRSAPPPPPKSHWWEAAPTEAGPMGGAFAPFVPASVPTGVPGFGGGSEVKSETPLFQQPQPKYGVFGP